MEDHGAATGGCVVSGNNKLIVMTVWLAGVFAVLGGIIGTARKWWRDGIDAEFLLLLALLYCACVIVEHLWGKDK